MSSLRPPNFGMNIMKEENRGPQDPHSVPVAGFKSPKNVTLPKSSSVLHEPLYMLSTQKKQEYSRAERSYQDVDNILSKADQFQKRSFTPKQFPNPPGSDTVKVKKTTMIGNLDEMKLQPNRLDSISPQMAGQRRKSMLKVQYISGGGLTSMNLKSFIEEQDAKEEKYNTSRKSKKGVKVPLKIVDKKEIYSIDDLNESAENIFNAPSSSNRIDGILQKWDRRIEKLDSKIQEEYSIKEALQNDIDLIESKLNSLDQSINQNQERMKTYDYLLLEGVKSMDKLQKGTLNLKNMLSRERSLLEY